MCTLASDPNARWQNLWMKNISVVESFAAEEQARKIGHSNTYKAF